MFIYIFVPLRLLKNGFELKLFNYFNKTNFIKRIDNEVYFIFIFIYKDSKRRISFFYVKVFFFL